jgi:hypothetical protein
MPVNYNGVVMDFFIRLAVCGENRETKHNNKQ